MNVFVSCRMTLKDQHMLCLAAIIKEMDKEIPKKLEGNKASSLFTRNGWSHVNDYMYFFFSN